MSTELIETLTAKRRNVNVLRTRFPAGDLWEVWFCDATCERAILAGSGTTRDKAVENAAALADAYSHALQSTPSPESLRETRGEETK